MVKIRVEVNLLKPLPESVFIGQEYEDSPLDGYTQKLKYEGIHEYCKHCRKLGHNVIECRALEKKIATNVEEVQDKIKEHPTKNKVAGKEQDHNSNIEKDATENRKNQELLEGEQLLNTKTQSLNAEKMKQMTDRKMKQMTDRPLLQQNFDAETRRKKKKNKKAKKMPKKKSSVKFKPAIRDKITKKHYQVKLSSVSQQLATSMIEGNQQEDTLNPDRAAEGEPTVTTNQHQETGEIRVDVTVKEKKSNDKESSDQQKSKGDNCENIAITEATTEDVQFISLPSEIKNQ
ncbi:uncharacterized protein [Nicotiana tomentosiformis]|uniref:uncharacterized protein n=1 Tax=Nicotiana tomentosiformis TaxID=4098 RepID=UPI00388CDF6D